MSPEGRPAHRPMVPRDLDQQLVSPAHLENPYPTYERLRAEAPVAWSDALNAWILTRYDGVLWAAREPTFAVGSRMPALLSQLPARDRQTANAIADHYSHTLPFTDPPRHTTVRALLQSKFTVAAVAALRPRIQNLVDSYLDEGENGDFDAMAQYANRLPVDVIGELLGVPLPDRPQFRPWTNQIIAIMATGRVQSDTAERCRQSLSEMRTYLGALIDDRRRQPGEDLVSWLLAQAGPGKTLSTEEVLANCVTLYTAGHGTTSGLIGKALLALFRHPAQLQQLRERPELISTAVEELTRFDTSVQRFWRIAGASVAVAGCVIPEGDSVLPILGSANHDPARFDHPDVLDIERQHNRHLAYGQGIHFCLGAGLARLETAVAVGTFVQRFPRATLIEDTVSWGTHLGLGSSFGTLVSLRFRLE